MGTSSPNLAVAMDSSSDEEVPSNLTRHKRPRNAPPFALGPAVGVHGGRESSHMPPPGYWRPSPWMQGGWNQYPSAIQSQAWHPSGGVPCGPYPGSWPLALQGEVNCSQESEGRATRRQKRHQNETTVASSSAEGMKTHQLRVKAGGEIDTTCDGKNAWDHAVRVSTPRIFDMSVVDWESQNPNSVALLRETLEKDFEYVGDTLSMQGFRCAIKKYMKAERARLKARFVSGKEACPIHIDPLQWDKLKMYWKTKGQVAKTAKMVQARGHVKDYSTMGRRGRAGKELAMSAKGAVCARLIALEEKQNDMVEEQKHLQGKMSQMLQYQSQNTKSMEEVMNMLKNLEKRFSLAESFTPSVGLTVVETQAQFGSTKQHLVAASSSIPLKMLVAALSIQLSQSSSDSEKGAPSVAKAKEPISLLQEQLMEDALASNVHHNNGDLVPTATTSTVAALVDQGSTALLSKEPTSTIVEDPTASSGVQEKVFFEGAPQEALKQHVEKDVHPESHVSELKKYSWLRRVKQVVEKPEEDSSTNKKNTAALEALDLSASRSPVVAQRSLRTSPRKQKVLLQSVVEDSATQEENSTKTKSGKPSIRSKPIQKKKVPSEKFIFGQAVFLLNPKNLKQSVASGTINGLGGQHKFHFCTIPEFCYKVDVKEAIWPQVSLLFPNMADDQTKVKDVVGSSTLWEGKFIKAAL